MGNRTRRHYADLMPRGKPLLLPLFLLPLSAICLGQAFHTEGRHPAAPEGLPLLAAVCPKSMGADLSCKTCPSFTEFKGRDGPYTLRNVIYGNFTAPSVEEAFVSFDGCAPPPAAGGSVLLRRSPAGWQMAQYVAGRYAWDCLRYPIKQRRFLLVCQDGWDWQGYNESEIFTLDFAAPEESRLQQVLHVVADNAGTCPETWKRIRFVKSEFRDLNYDAMRDLLLFAGMGQVRVPAEYRKKCLEGMPPPELKTVKLDFLFNGKVFLAAPWSAAQKKLLEDF